MDMNVEEEIRLRDEIRVLRAQNAELQALDAALRLQLAETEQRLAVLEQAKKDPPAFLKPNKPRREGPRAPRRPRAKEQNRGRRRSRGARNTG